MILMIGKTLGHYQITSQLGKGGMGEVYRARDEKLGRDVAIKVLPEEFARDADRVARFQREAKLLASLNNPNIAAIYGLEESGGTQFLVLELVEGETLADQLKRGPISVEESLKLALQIAEALEAAHDKGIIHRDLKPANIKVTPDCKVKVLDFGLAKAFAAEQAEANLSHSPTLSNVATMQGVILGTAAYMSPEQARGKPADKRADIWAFGCLLYEMLAGQAAFQGEDVTEILAAVVKSTANLDLLPANIHPRIRELIIRCLQKDLKKRYSGIADVVYEIEQALTDSRGDLVKPAIMMESRTKLHTQLPLFLAALILGATITGVVVWNLRKPEQRQAVRFDYDLPEDQEFINLLYPVLSVSPDGRQFVYVTNKGLYLRSMNKWTARRISNIDENPRFQCFSPDGQWITYCAGGKLKKIAVSGAGSMDLCDVTDLVGVSWDADDTIVYTDRKSIQQISANGGTPETLVEAKKDETIYHPTLLPDGKSAMFTLGPAPYRIAVQSLKSRDRKILFPGDAARYIPTGHIVYALANNLFAVPFDVDTLKWGESVQMIEDVLRSSARYTPQYVVSNSGTLIYIPEGSNASIRRNLVWVNRQGREEVLKAEVNAYNYPRISPDGKRIALSITTGNTTNIWIWDCIRETWNRLTTDASIDILPLWTRDSRRIFFASDSRLGGTMRVYWRAADGTGEAEQLGGVPATEHHYPRDWSPGANDLILTQITNNTDIEAVSMEGERKWRPLLKTKYNETEPRISPDGKWMAYASDESGRNEVYVRPFPDVESGGRLKASTGGGSSPLWSPDGRELFYRNGAAVISVPVRTSPEFNLESPKILFSSQDVSGWDIHPDGKRFLMIKEAGGGKSVGARPQRINIVLNWFEELKQRVPR
jgi:eukaryotic-like serine/threonine-protein kinase